MSSVQSADIQTTASSTATNINTNKKIKAEDQQDRFLKLLVAQVKNQDPLKPLDNAEMTSQMAQISTVTGIEKLNTTLQQLASSTEDTRAVEAMGLIGHSVFVPGRSLTLNGESASVGIDLTQPVDQLKVTIFDSAGIPIRQMELGPKPSGFSNIPWDGKTDTGSQAAIGEYTFAVSATQGGNDIKVEQFSLGQVRSVAQQDDKTLLDMGDKLGLVSLADVKQVF